MTLSISAEEVDDYAAALDVAGITIFKVSYRGPEVVFSEGSAERAHEALDLVLARMRQIEGKDGRRQFLELLDTALLRRIQARENKKGLDPVTRAHLNAAFAKHSTS